ncbi:MAG: hypothetical protein ACRCU3_01725 [Eubacteriaceae bacterium]
MIFLFIIYLFCTVGGLTLVKVGADNNAFALSSNYFDLSLSYTTILGLFLYVISFVMWIVIVQKYDLSYIQPIALGLSNILIIAASIFILGESIGLFQWLGIVCILGGVILMNVKV